MKRMEINHHFPRFSHHQHPSVAAQRRAELRRHIDDFLANGGQIRVIPFGTSAFSKPGQPDGYQFNRTQ